MQGNGTEHGWKLDDLAETPGSAQQDELLVRVAYLWGNADNLPPSFHSQVCAYDTTYPRSEHVSLVVQQNCGVVVKPNEPAVWSSNSLLGTDDDGATNVPLADFYSRTRRLSSSRYRSCAFHDADNFVTNTAPAVVDLLLENVDAFDQEGAGVVYDLFAICQLHPTPPRAGNLH